MNISAIGKTLDQPLLISKLRNQTPKILAAGAFAFGLYDTMKTPKEERRKRGIKNAVILTTTAAVSLMSAFGIKAGGKQVFKGLVEIPSQEEVLKANAKAVDKFLSENKVNKGIKHTLEKAKSGLLNVKDTENLLKDKDSFKNADALFETLFSSKSDLSAKEIFEETGRLSILGLAPVAAGVASGIAADKLTNNSSKDETKKAASDKIKEGVYQFLANIFMCNVGAAGALFGAERLHQKGVIKSLTPLKKLGVIMGGIFVTGIMGGSIVANFVGKKFLDPLFEEKNKQKQNPSTAIDLIASQHKVYDCFRFTGETKKRTDETGGVKNWLYSERKPELLDLALHTDDIATAGVLSGFRWIEPMLPLMYVVSGYRAGIGYRNVK